MPYIMWRKPLKKTLLLVACVLKRFDLLIDAHRELTFILTLIFNIYLYYPLISRGYQANVHFENQTTPSGGTEAAWNQGHDRAAGRLS